MILRGGLLIGLVLGAAQKAVAQPAPCPWPDLELSRRAEMA